MTPDAARKFLESISYVPGVSGTRGMPEDRRLQVKLALGALGSLTVSVPLPKPKVRPEDAPHKARTEADMGVSPAKPIAKPPKPSPKPRK